MSLEGRILGSRYEILKQIGNGGMAVVYKATDLVLKRYVAVKILKDEFTTDNEFIKRFETEAQSAARLVHPNIVSIFDVGVDNGIYYIVMELIQGKTLKEIIIEERGPVPWKWSVNVAIQIASALEMAHKNNIIHRDIKPHNIIITEDGVAKVTDFGIAKAVSNSTITAFGTAIGSVHYFSPEHARGGFTDAKSDLYSLGIVLYEMVTGKVPFDADTPVSVALKHLQEEPKPPISLNANLPPALDRIIMKAIKKDPLLRYQTSTEMLEDLRAALKNPSGDFVEEKTYDPTAATQKISTEYINKSQNNKKENAFIKFVKEHKVLSGILGAILLFFVAFESTALILKVTNPKEVELPNIVGMQKSQAEEVVENLKLKFEVEAEEYNSEYEKNLIISQDPTYLEKYNKVKQGSTVKVKVSLGTETTVVPVVKGETEEEAIKKLETAKLKAEIIKETSKTIPEGVVISQETDANTEINAGETIKLHVSSGTGIKQVTMIDVVGKKEIDAKKLLEDMNLVVNIGYSENTAKDEGVVLTQSKALGEVIDEGTTITITVNKLAEKKSVPITVNVKSLLMKTLSEKDLYETITTNTSSGKNEENESQNEVEQTVVKKPKTVKLKVTVGADTIYESNVEAIQTAVNVGNAVGTGTTEVKVYINGVLKNNGDTTLKFSDTNSFVAE